MNSPIKSKLLKEICTITTSNHILVGQIIKIYPDKFAVRLLPVTGDKKIISGEVQIRVETLDNEIFFYVALVDSQHLLNTRRIIFFKPVSELYETNRRNDQRLKIETCLKPTDLHFRQFPPIDTQWIKGRLIDISRGGLQIKCDTYLSKGNLIEIKLAAPILEKTEVIISRIVNTKKEGDAYVSSIQFINLPESHQQKIEHFIQATHEKIRSMAD